MQQDSWALGHDRLETVPCPSCGGTAFELLATTDRYDMGLHTSGCSTCGLVMSNPQPTAEALDTFYRQHYRSFYQGAAEPSLAYIHSYRKDERCAEAVAFMQRSGLLREGMKALDIGASEGVLLHALAQQVPTARRVAVEPNPVFGAFAVQHAGCTLHASVEALVAAGEGGFDLISMVHVYEHIKQPVQFLRALKPLLASGGKVYIDVPDITTYGRLNDLHIAHLYHFGPDTLARAAAVAGYRVEVCERHLPIKHPKSLRCVLVPDALATAPAPGNLLQGWQATRRAGRHVWAAHRRRWPWTRRLRHMLGL